MYNPDAFKKEDAHRLLDFIEKNSFGVLVSRQNEEWEASHLPVLVDRSGGPQGTLLSHMAKANSQWNTLAGQEVLMIFRGPHAYVSPTWYETPGSVPTWNYVAVHVYGRFVPVTDEKETTEILMKMVRFYEGSLPQPWDMASLPGDHFKRLLNMIVGFRIENSRLEGKWKLSQNHSVEKRLKVAQALERGGPQSQEVAKLMRDEMK